MKRESFIVYKSFYALIKLLPPKERLKMYESIFEYGFNGEFPDFKDETSDAIWQAIFPQLKANQKRYENSLKGGAPKNNQNAQKKQPNDNEENNQNETEKTTKKQPNENDNVNDNENVNVNDNLNKASMHIKKEETNKACACVRGYHFEDYSEVMEDCALEESVKPVMWEFIKHCQLNGRKVTNDKLSGICLEMDYQGLSEEEKIQKLLQAINGGFYDIKR